MDGPVNTEKENQNKMSQVKTGGFKNIPFVKIFIPDTITVCWGRRGNKCLFLKGSFSVDN